jgi:hypothetical protein
VENIQKKGLLEPKDFNENRKDPPPPGTLFEKILINSYIHSSRKG